MRKVRVSAKSKPSASGSMSIARDSLIAQSVRMLREQIHAGTWVRTLPGERRLCDLLSISRPTLRSALAILEKEGLLVVSQGKLRAIRLEKTRKSALRGSSRQVVILCPESLLRMQPSTLYLIDETYSKLQKAGYKLGIHSPSWLNFRRPEKYLDKHVRENPSTCWALFSTSEAVQKWFSASSERSVVSGSCFPGVEIPNIDLDSRAATMHAVGMFLRFGHRDISLLVPETFRPGHVIIQQAFMAAVGQSRHANTSARVLRVSPNRGIFERQLAEHMDFRRPSQALLITQSLDTLFTLTYLLRQKIAVGSKVAVISNGDEFFFEHMTPTPARYRIPREKFAAKFCRLLLQLVQSDAIPVKTHLISMDFLPGQTLQHAEGGSETLR